MLYLETRQTILAEHAAGVSVHELCARHGVGKTAVYRLLKQARETGDIAPHTSRRGRKKALDQAQLDAIRRLLREKGNVTLRQIREDLSLPVSLPVLCRYVHMLDGRAGG